MEDVNRYSEAYGLLIDLFAIQKAHHWSDREMAKRLGISRVHWLRIRAGKGRPGRKVFVGVFNAFPELQQQALDYLRTM